MTSLRILKICILVHGPGTRPQALVEWAEERGHTVELRHLYRSDHSSGHGSGNRHGLLPELHEFDFLISTGGLMNCMQDAEFPFLALEAKLLEQAIRANKGVLGLCLGAQLMARALGANVKKNRHWEVGWHAVDVDDAYLGRSSLQAFQWHQDTFDLPEGAVRIASNEVTPNQAFRLSDRAIGVQFHPEAVREWVEDCARDPEYPAGPYVQPPEDLVQGLIHQPALNYWLRSVLQQIEGAL